MEITRQKDKILTCTRSTGGKLLGKDAVRTNPPPSLPINGSILFPLGGVRDGEKKERGRERETGVERERFHSACKCPPF